MIRNIMRRNRFFDRVINESLDDIGVPDVTENENQLQLSMGILDDPLEQIFSDVLAAARKENTLTYSNLSISKKSIPYTQLDRIFAEVMGENEEYNNILDGTSNSLNERANPRNKTKFYNRYRNL